MEDVHRIILETQKWKLTYGIPTKKEKCYQVWEQWSKFRWSMPFITTLTLFQGLFCVTVVFARELKVNGQLILPFPNKTMIMMTFTTTFRVPLLMSQTWIEMFCSVTDILKLKNKNHKKWLAKVSGTLGTRTPAGARRDPASCCRNGLCRPALVCQEQPAAACGPCT